jgi:hypothetical protein
VGYLRQVIRDSRPRPPGPSQWTPQAPPDLGAHADPSPAPEPQPFDQAPSDAAAPERVAPQPPRRRILRLLDGPFDAPADARQASSPGVQPAPAGRADRSVNAGPDAPNPRVPADWLPPPPAAGPVASRTPIAHPLPSLPSPGPSRAGGVASPGVAVPALPEPARTPIAPAPTPPPRPPVVQSTRPVPRTSRHAAPPESDAAFPPLAADAHPTPVSATSTRPLAPIPAAPADRAAPEPAEVRIGQVDVFLRDPAPARAAKAKAARPGPSASRLYLRRL